MIIYEREYIKFFLVSQNGVFGQQTPKSNIETESCNFSNVRINRINLSHTNCDEASLKLYLNEKLDEDLLKILNRTVNCPRLFKEERLTACILTSENELYEDNYLLSIKSLNTIVDKLKGVEIITRK